jgi:RNA polymerase sigma-70 factor (ECF subfamily)
MNTETDFEAYRDQIRRYISHLVQDPVQAEDLVQDTFLRAHTSRESLRDPAALRAWLYRIATNVCYDHFRRLTSPVAAPLLDLELAGLLEGGTAKEPEEPGIDELVERSEMSRCVQKLINQLPETYRLAILLHDVHGLTNAEAALVLDCSLEAAKIHLHRARRKLKEALLQACEFSRDERGVFVCQPKLPDRQAAFPISITPKKIF